MTKAAPKPLTVGDTVYLKSGSQRMVIEEITDGVAKVVWMIFDAAEIRRDAFPVAVLKGMREYEQPKETK